MKNCLIILIIIYNAQAIAQYVTFGQRNLAPLEYAIYIDKEGSLYPNINISDTELTNAGGSLKSFFQKNPKQFITSSEVYSIKVENYSEDNFTLLQQAIHSKILQDLRTFQESPQSLTFLIHGFRKPFQQIAGEYTSPEDYSMLKKSINNFSTDTTKFIEIYWDSYYDCRFGSKLKKNKELYQLFEKAQSNATYVANSFRKILSGLKDGKVNIVTHSLGAKVATQALFNFQPLDQNIETPHCQINLCLIAPAISGKEIFEKFYDRTTTIDYKTDDNYRVAIVYNRHDFVLRKEFKFLSINLAPGPYKYGTTTLGCDYDSDATNLKKIFEKDFKNSEIELFDRSNIGKCHYLGTCYSANINLQGMVKFMEK